MVRSRSLVSIDSCLVTSVLWCQKILGLQQNKTELGSVQRLTGNAFGARNEDDELRCHHAMELIAGRVRKEIGGHHLPGNRATKYGFPAYSAELPSSGGTMTKSPRFQPRDKSSLAGLVEQTAGERNREADSLCGLPPS